MTITAGQSKELNPTRDDFATLLNESFGGDSPFEGSVIKG